MRMIKKGIFAGIMGDQGEGDGERCIAMYFCVCQAYLSWHLMIFLFVNECYWENPNSGTKELNCSSKNFAGRKYYFWSDKNASVIRWGCMTEGDDILRTQGLFPKREKCLDIWFCQLGFKTFCHVQAMSRTCLGHVQEIFK